MTAAAKETAFRRRVKKPFPDFAELYSVFEKLGILRRAWSRWGWRGVKTALLRERDVHRLLTRERIIGLDLLMGTRVARAGEEASADEPATSTGARNRKASLSPDAAGDRSVEGDGPSADVEEPEEKTPEEKTASEEETVGLPLFHTEDTG